MKERRRYARMSGEEKAPVNILFEHDLRRNFVNARIVDQSEGGAQFVTDKTKDIKIGSFAVLKASSGWPLPEKRATAKVVWTQRENGKVRFGCKYLSPMLGVPRFF